METNSLSDLTNKIIETRKLKSKEFDSYRKKIENIEKTLDFILNLRNKDLWNNVITESNCTDNWNELKENAEILNEKLQKFCGPDGDFTIAESRAHRTYVNIGSIGIMREGKSEFIAQTTQLDKWILPRKKGEHACTTASINIINGSSPDGKKEIARIHYYTVQEIVFLFADYLEEFGLDRNLIDCNIKTRVELQEWCKSNFESMESKISSSKVKLKTKFLEYIKYVDKYINHLVETNDSNPILFKDYQISEILDNENIGKEYYSSVSYYETPDATEEVFRSFATRKAEIYTSFKVDGTTVDNIQFLDTPGIGEKKVGVDRILSEAVSMNLDIIIAIRALNGSAKEDQEQSFISILRSKVEGKNSAKDWIYYLLNIWEGQEYSDAQKCIKSLKYYLKTGEKKSSIELGDEHFRVINLRDGYQLNPDGTTDSNNPIGKYLKAILENIIPNIEDIDVDFFRKATSAYKEISEKYKELLSLAKRLHLYEYDDYGRIQSLISSLQIALAKENAKNPKIFTNIRHSIDDFCELKEGYLVAKVFNVSNLNFNNSDDFYDKNKLCVQAKYDEGSYNSNYDFQTYGNLKGALMKIIKEDICKRMDKTEADRLLNEVKKTIANVFMEDGKMKFISDLPEEWFSKMVEVLEKDGVYPNIYSIIKTFAELEIQTELIIQPRIDTVITRCVHHDDFGDPEEYDFQEYENAVKTVIHSLFAIENYAKGLINDGLISGDIDQLQNSFSKTYFNLTKFAANLEPHISGVIKDELYHFYENYSTKVFLDDESLQKRGLVTEWKNSINNI